MKRLFINFGKQTIIYGLGDVLYKAVAFFLIPFYLKYLDTFQYGTIEVLMVTRGLIVTFICMGLPNAVFRFYYRAKDEVERKKIVSTIFFLSLLVQISIPLIFFWKSELIANLILKNSEFGFLFALLAVTIFLTSFRYIPLALFRAREKAMAYTSINFIVALVTLLMNIFFVAVLKKGVMGVILGNLCGAGIGIVVIAPTVLRDIDFVFAPKLVKKILVFAVPLGLSLLPVAVIFMADRYFLAQLTNLHDLGIYALAYKFGSIINIFLIMPFALAWGPFVFSNEKNKKSKEIYSRMSTYFVIAGVSVVVMVSVFSVNVIRILTKNAEFYDASKIIPVLCYSFFLYGLAYIYRTGILISGKTYLSTIIMCISLCLNLILNFILISAIGYQGAGYSLLITFMSITVLSYFFSSRLCHIDYKIGKMLKIISLSIIVVIFSQTLIPENIIHSLLVKILLVLLFFVSLYLIGLSREEKKQIKRLVGNKVVAWGIYGKS